MSTTTPTNEPEGGNAVDQLVPLAQAETTQPIPFGEFPKDSVKIRTRVTVQKCPHGFKSRLGYHAKLYIKFPEDIEREIGYITAWRLSRPTRLNNKIDTGPSVRDWDWRNLDTYDDQSRQMAHCYRVFYGEGTGNFPEKRRESDRLLNKTKWEQMRNNETEIIYIQTIYIKWREDPLDANSEYSGYRLAADYLNQYYRLLGGKILPAWYTLRGAVTYLLLPRLQHESPINHYWNHLQEEQGYGNNELEKIVADTLIHTFKQDEYGYEEYVINATVPGAPAPITVLGKVVEDPTSDTDDHLILPSGT